MGWRDKWHLKSYRYLIKNHWNSSHPSCSSEAIVCLNHPQLWMGQLYEHIYDSDWLLKFNHSAEDPVVFIAPATIRVFLLCLREFLWSMDWWIYYDLHHRGNHGTSHFLSGDINVSIFFFSYTKRKYIFFFQMSTRREKRRISCSRTWLHFSRHISRGRTWMEVTISTAPALQDLR